MNPCIHACAQALEAPGVDSDNDDEDEEAEEVETGDAAAAAASSPSSGSRVVKKVGVTNVV